MALNNGGFMCVFLVDNFCCYELHNPCSCEVLLGKIRSRCQYV